MSTLTNIHADFTKRVVITPAEYGWVPSPQPGVERMLLDRIGDEKARATSIVRYARGSYFPAHAHPEGEEILVLSGTFSEDGRDYPAGSYLRSPPGSQHQPSSRTGALIFVKLRQMRSSESDFVRIDTNDPQRWSPRADGESCSLYTDAFERVSILCVREGARVLESHVDSAELLLLSGEIAEDNKRYSKGTWMRLPAGSYPELVTGRAGACYYLKTRVVAF